MHERQPHQTLRGRVWHQRIEECVEGDLFLLTLSARGERARVTHNVNAKTITESLKYYARRLKGHSLAVQSRLLQLVLCNQRRVPRKPPSVIWELPSEIGQTVSTPLFQRNLISVKKYLGTRAGDITQINQTNCQLPPQSANYSITQYNYPTYLWKQIKVKQLSKSAAIIYPQHGPPFFLSWTIVPAPTDFVDYVINPILQKMNHDFSQPCTDRPPLSLRLEQ